MNYPNPKVWTQIGVQVEPEPVMSRYCKVYDAKGNEHVTLFAESFTQERVDRWAEREFMGARS